MLFVSVKLIMNNGVKNNIMVLNKAEYEHKVKQTLTQVKKFHVNKDAVSKSAMDLVNLFPNKREHVIALVQTYIDSIKKVHEAIYSLDTDSERKEGIASVKKMCDHLAAKTDAFTKGASVIGEIQAIACRLLTKQEEKAARAAAASSNVTITGNCPAKIIDSV